jgi:holin-like protein
MTVARRIPRRQYRSAWIHFKQCAAPFRRGRKTGVPPKNILWKNIPVSNNLVYMRYIKQLGLILAFAFAGELIARLISGGLPASVTGMILLLAALGFKLLKPAHIGETADFLSGVMAFFFLPSAVTILQNFDVIRPVVWRLLVICVLCTFFTLFVTYGTVRLLQTLLKRKK